MNYIINDNADLISKELYKISRPNTVNQDDETQYYLEWIEKGIEKALKINDLDFTIIVHPDHNLDNLILLVGPAYTTEQIDAIIELLNDNSTIKFSDLLVPTIQVHDTQYMIDHGWIEALPPENG